MKVLAVVVNYRTAGMTIDAVASLLGALSGVESQVAVVDNGSGDGSIDSLRDAVAQRGWQDSVRVLCSGYNGGFAFGVNVGLKLIDALEAKPEYVYLLNSDAFPESDAVSQMVGYMDEHTEVGILGSAIYGIDDVAHQTAFRFPSMFSEFERSLRLGIFTRMLRHWVVASGNPVRASAVDWVAGASMMLREAMIEDIGQFDDEYFLYFEETDYCLRASRKGWMTHYLPSSRVMHIGSVSTGMRAWARTPAYWFESRRRYFSKNYGRLYLWATNAAWILGYSLWSVRRILQGKPQADPPRTFVDFLAYNLLGRRSG